MLKIGRLISCGPLLIRFASVAGSAVHRAGDKSSKPIARTHNWPVLLCSVDAKREADSVSNRIYVACRQNNRCLCEMEHSPMDEKGNILRMILSRYDTITRDECTILRRWMLEPG